MPFLPPFSFLPPSFIYLFIYFLSFYAKPLNLVDIDTDSYIEGSLPILFLVCLSSFVSIGDPYLFGPIRKYFIISVFAIQYKWVFHNIYMPLLLSVFSGNLVEYSNGRFFFFSS